MAVDDELAGEGLEPSFVGDGARTVVRPEWKRDGILPPATWIIFCKFNAVDVGHKERVDVNMVCVDRIGAVLDGPFFGGAALHHVFYLA